MNASQQLREQIWDYVYGLLSDDESRALVDRIKSDPQIARLYAEVRLQADLVAQAARIREAALEIKGPHPEVVPAADKTAHGHVASAKVQARPVAAGKVASWLPALATVALAVLVAVGFFWPRPDEQQIAASMVAADLVAPRPLSAGLTTRVTLRTYTAIGAGDPGSATAATATVRLVDRDGRERMQQEIATDESGQAEIVLPGEALEPGVHLEVADLVPRAIGERAGARGGPSALPPLVAELPVQAEPVMAYFLLAEPTVEPGKQVPFSAWNVTAFSAKPAQTQYTQAAVEAIGGAAVVQTPASAAAAEGVVSGFVQVPSDFSDGTLTLQAVEPEPGAGQVAIGGRGRALPQTQSYRFQSQLRRGQAAPADQQAIVRQRTQSTPRGGRGLAEPAAQAADKALADRSAAENEQREEPLVQPADNKASERLAAESDEPPPTIAAGQPLRVAVPQELAGKPLAAVAVCRGVTVATVAAEPPKAATVMNGSQTAAAGQVLTIDLPPEVDGLIDVELFDRSADETQPVARTMVFREPQRQLRIEMPPPKERFAPGEEVRLSLQVLDEQNRPAADTRLGVRVWNEELVQQVEEQPVLLADLVRNVTSDAVREAAQAQSSGSFAPSAAIDAVAKRDDRSGAGPAGGSASTSEPAGPVELASNRALVVQAVHNALAESRRQQQEAVRRLGIAVVAIGAAVLLILAVSALGRQHSSGWLNVPAAVVAGASLVIGLVWIGRPPAPIRGDLAMAPRAATAESATSGASTSPADDFRSAELGAEKATSLADLGGGERLARDHRREQEGVLNQPASSPTGAAELADERQPARPPVASGRKLAAAGTAPGSGKTTAPAVPAAGQPAQLAASGEADQTRREASADSRARLAGGLAGRPASGGADLQPLRITGPVSAMPAIESPPRPSAPLSASASGSSAPVAGARAPAESAKLQSAAPAALYFNPELVTDSEGRATVQFTMPSMPAKYRVLVDALGQGRLGSGQQTLECITPPAAEQPAK